MLQRTCDVCKTIIFDGSPNRSVMRLLDGILVNIELVSREGEPINKTDIDICEVCLIRVVANGHSER